MKKVGIIRCRQTEEFCAGHKDFAAAKAGALAFEQFGPCEIVGFVSCGGCPGKVALARAQTLVQFGAEAIFMASCITKGNPFGMPCPNAEAMRESIRKKIGPVPLIDWTH